MSTSFKLKHFNPPFCEKPKEILFTLTDYHLKKSPSVTENAERDEETKNNKNDASN